MVEIEATVNDAGAYLVSNTSLSIASASRFGVSLRVLP
jgi:hypothetical protein